MWQARQITEKYLFVHFGINSIKDIELIISQGLGLQKITTSICNMWTAKPGLIPRIVITKMVVHG